MLRKKDVIFVENLIVVYVCVNQETFKDTGNF